MSAPDRNRLGDSASPYLIQHRDNPVHWQVWGPDALAAAQVLDRPILLSVGYAACHWCHVMAHESFEDPETAAVMNELFVNIKVDREERPDIDTIYMTALSMLGEQGGWPLTMFLTPAGEPFWGGTYFPPTARWGRPAFRDVLRRVAEIYRTDRDTIEKNRAGLLSALRDHNKPAAGVAPVIEPALLDKVAHYFLDRMDMAEGGLKGAPKFPQPSVLSFLWRAGLRTGDARFADAVLLTLEKMSQGGIYDHLGGGYARYSTDAVWLAPHFEKMLYDNAQLLDLLGLAWARTRNPLFEQRTRETVEWLSREMIADGGGFAATLDADSEGEEGRFYVWTEAEIDAVLGVDSPTFKAAYDVTPGGNWEHHNILRRTLAPAAGDADAEALLAKCRARLLSARDKRVRPGWDDKVLSDWNGMMIAALATAAMRFREPEWLAAALRAFGFVSGTMGRADRLLHAWRRGQEGPIGMLDDYAQMGRAALVLYQATGDAALLAQAERWADTVERHFRAGDGGYYLTADDAEALIVRTRHCHDNATPAGNSVMLEVLATLWLLTGKEVYRARADDLVAAFAPELNRNVFPLTGLLAGAEMLNAGQQVVIAGAHGEPEADALILAAFDAGVPHAVIHAVPDAAALPADHPAVGKGGISGRPAAYVCVGPRCSLPIMDAATLREKMQQGL